MKPNPRWWKEFRPLILPASLTASATLLPLLQAGGDWLHVFVVFAFCCGFSLLAALPYGAECQQRTVGLLLSQPLARKRIWREKFQVLGLTALALAYVIGLLETLLGEGSIASFVIGFLSWPINAIPYRATSNFFIGFSFLFAAICSSGFWWLRLRSRTGAILVAGVSQFCLFLVLNWIVSRIYGSWISESILDQFGVIFLASLLYGTMWVWLGWPYWRGRKVALVVTMVSYVLLGALFPASISYLPNLFPPQSVLLMAFVFVTVCSGCYWSLLARTAIGGAAFNLVSQFLIFVALMFVLNRIGSIYLAVDLSLREWRIVVPILGTGVAYGLLMLWLGKRKFERLELSEVRRALPVDASGATRFRIRWLTCRPEGSVANLVRKEILLQKPLFYLALLFVMCWLVTLALFLPIKDLQELCGPLLNLLTTVYATVTIVLAGCVSLGEEKGLGLTAWHLSLPVSLRAQWLLKLVISAAVGALLGVLLPWFLVSLTPGRAHAELSNFVPIIGVYQIPWSVVVPPVALTLFALSFWAVTLFGNTVRAVLVTGIGVGVLCGGIPVLIGLVEHQGGLEMDLLAWLFETIGVPPAEMQACNALLMSIGAMATTLTALLQSARQYHQAIIPQRVLIKYAAALAAVALIAGFWCSDLAVSLKNLPSPILEKAELHVLNDIVAKL